MALHYGHNDEIEKIRDEIKLIKNSQLLQYTLTYPRLTLDIATYSERKTFGYKYISAHGLNSKSTITFLTHSFSTSSGLNIPGDTIMYSFEFLNKDSKFEYFNIKKINISSLRIPKPGRKYNIFLLNKTFVFSEITKLTDFSNFIMFSVFITQKSGLISNDSSELELYITL